MIEPVAKILGSMAMKGRALVEREVVHLSLKIGAEY